MAWNDSKITLVAPAWKMVTENSLNQRRTVNDATLRVLKLERKDGPSSCTIRPERIYAWLDQRGFELAQKSRFGDRVKKDDVEIAVGVIDDEVAELLITFVLSRDSPSRWCVWRQLVEALCETWGFTLFDPESDSVVASSEVLRVLSSSQAWRDFSAKLGWPSVI